MVGRELLEQMIGETNETEGLRRLIQKIISEWALWRQI